MKRAAAIVVLSMIVAAVSAQEVETTVRVDSIVVTAPHSLREVGIQKTAIDDMALRSGIAQSLAEVLAQNSTVFIKSSGRASLSTASLRGAAASHTRVSWNGMSLQNPMLGMTDFSMIPSYLVDRSNVFFGASSVASTGGGLGGAVELSNAARQQDGFGAEYIQNIASYHTFDEFLHLHYGSGGFETSTRLLRTSSDNDFTYTNYDKLGHPTERNRSCGWLDMHALQEFYYTTRSGDKLSAALWLTDSSRGIPRLTVDYRSDGQTLAQQDERSARSVLKWEKSVGALRLGARAGYAATSMRYLYKYSNGGEEMMVGVDSKSHTTSLFGHLNADWSIGNTLMLQLSADAARHDVESRNDVLYAENGYTASRNEYSFYGSVRWRPFEGAGLALNVREECVGGGFTPPIPALFAEYVIWPRMGLTVSASATRNYRQPSLNDLYYVPGGNPALRPEKGVTVDGGFGFEVKRRRTLYGGKFTAFGSETDDWILWQPTAKGFWTPMNIARVSGRGIETSAHLETETRGGLRLKINAFYGITRSQNTTEGNAGYGKQLPYIPLHSAATTASLEWRGWAFTYKWQYYSERFTTYAVGAADSYTLPDYYMSDVSLSKYIDLRAVGLRVRLDCNNLLDEEYQSILARPMPGRNFAVSVELAWKNRNR